MTCSDYRGVLPPDVQATFDHAKAIERGRRGRALSNMIAPDLAAALSLYESGLAELVAFGRAPPAGREEEYERTVGSFERRVAEIRARLCTAAGSTAENPFDEVRRSHHIFDFDLTRHNLLGAMRRVLELDDDADLSRLHETFHTDTLQGPPPICPSLLWALARERKLPSAWRALAGRAKEHIRSFRRTPQYEEWLECFREFVRSVVVPLVGERVACQCPPTLRFQFPSARALGHRHRDDAYEGHQGCEINFCAWPVIEPFHENYDSIARHSHDLPCSILGWAGLPLTRTYAANTLHVETAPGRGDFSPVELSPGQCLRFNGSECEHFTLPNSTDDTRTSLDFRVIPISHWRDKFGGRIGSYPCEIIG